MCTLKRSLKIGVELEFEEQKDLCETRAIKKFNAAPAKCASGLFLDSSHVSDPSRTSGNRKCLYNRLGFPEDREEVDAQCGLGRWGYQVCPLREGDESFWRANSLVADLWEQIKKEDVHCHFLSPFSCYEIRSSTDKFVGLHIAQALGFELKNYVALQNMDTCVKKVFFPDYWAKVRPMAEKEILSQYDDNASVLYFSFVSTLAVILSMYF